MIRVLLVDDHPLVLEGINACLSNVAGIEVVGQANNGLEALELAEALTPDVVLMDVTMPVMNGLEATRELKRRFPDYRVLILSMHENREYILQLIQSGAAGYVLKDVPSEELVTAIEIVNQGGTYFSSKASETLMKQFEHGRHTDIQRQELTKREKTVLKHLAEGDSNKEIARRLDISVRTVETHRQNIKQKLNIQTAAGLAKYAIENNMI
ncbi:response regulator transcription factor [Neptunomonas phycophila]|jgi:two-component system nitrate/nitrite response regulator NarL|uniref:Response regulator transcription factor n=1 Tax=Neptunomonas phycophila TaxID=1572645 RepID=A0AAW7XNC1_9GAMM|nr:MULTISPECIES: response regulator transcription factor [Neptunomonas]MBT3146511.1 response regulator transcription factor [Neptunomonas phycophila]MDN2658782.1 response regulator transcription factor [Neptunomonas sp. CHC150]MDO6454833.1 response regulator transcription factor [Neptunomonas phycophila]MDO6469024.1 response regulator transcription factor [Neptunomonas phycophila]MDO6785039.1 response regulator transcription factor [Neptunomonas phycophila]